MKLKIFTISFDDGHPYDKIAAEIMLKYGIRGTFYPNFYRIDECHKEIHDKLEVGSHGLTHNNPLEMSYEKLKEFLDKKPFEDFLEKRIEMFASPWGFYNEAIITMVKEEGYIGARDIKIDPTYSFLKNHYQMHITWPTGKIPTFEEFKEKFDLFLKIKEGLFHLNTHCSGIHLDKKLGFSTFDQFEQICKYIRNSKIDSLTNSEIIKCATFFL